MTDWTLASIKSRNLALEGYCQTEGCKRFFTFDLDRLIGLAGPDYIVPDFIPDMVCTECGGPLKTMLAMAPPAEED
jgi:hypothetical protein